jgi:cytochrome c
MRAGLVSAVAIAGVAAGPRGAAAEPAASPPAFAVCAGCHSAEPGKTKIGPSLAGVVGRKAGSMPGYAYSDALKISGLTWNADNLDKWLTSPQKAVPGTRMPFAGMADPARRKAVIEYLSTLE